MTPSKEPLTPPQLRKMMALWRQASADRAARLALTSAIIGRTVKSSTTLTRREASLVIDWLSAR